MSALSWRALCRKPGGLPERDGPRRVLTVLATALVGRHLAVRSLFRQR